MASHIFFSHGSEDRAEANEIAAYLEQTGLQIWIAPRDVRPGRDYSEQLQDAIEQSAACIVLVSDRSNKSPYVRAETEMAFSTDKPLYPVRTSDVAPASGLALFLKIKHWTDVYGPDKDRNLARLADELHLNVGQKATPVAAPPPPAVPAEARPDVHEEPVAPAAPAAAEPSAAPTVIAGSTSPPANQGAPAGGAPPKPIEVGDLLNHMFEVKRFIKAGGMGQVFEGASLVTGERVAIKALLPAMAANPNVVELFQREAMTLTRLNHEALVQYRAMAKEPTLGILYIVTEFVDGGDLGDVLDRGRRDGDELKRLLIRLASGLAAAHRLGAIHRDMSPDNVMLPGGDLHQAKIIDFGIAKDLAGALPTLIGDSFAGKLSYVAPEQLGDHDGRVGTWTDVYSLALVILSVARGEKTDMGGSFADAIRKRREVPDLSAAPESLRPLLADMLRPDPAERVQTMDEVIARLAEPPRAEAVAPAPPVAPPLPPAAPVIPPPPAPAAPQVVTAAPAQPMAVNVSAALGDSGATPARRSMLIPALIGATVVIALLLTLFVQSRRFRPVASGRPASAPEAPAYAPGQASGVGAWLVGRWTEGFCGNRTDEDFTAYADGRLQANEQGRWNLSGNTLTVNYPSQTMVFSVNRIDADTTELTGGGERIRYVRCS